MPPCESDDRKTGNCINAIWANVDESDPVRSPDPIAFVYVFARILDRLVPFDVIQRHRDEIYETMDELAEIITEGDGSLWSYSRQNCVEWAYAHFRSTGLGDSKLRYKLRSLGATWNSRRCN